mmetsp:Transcript_8894/g.29509  ORF Transcript_8894/g.29509 Transcript_8894/m.29509 type:complete len:335 (+) Transcript_8894:226-1230(+)
MSGTSSGRAAHAARQERGLARAASRCSRGRCSRAARSSTLYTSTTSVNHQPWPKPARPPSTHAAPGMLGQAASVVPKQSAWQAAGSQTAPAAARTAAPLSRHPEGGWRRLARAARHVRRQQRRANRRGANRRDARGGSSSPLSSGSGEEPRRAAQRREVERARRRARRHLQAEEGARSDAELRARRRRATRREARERAGRDDDDAGGRVPHHHRLRGAAAGRARGEAEQGWLEQQLRQRDEGREDSHRGSPAAGRQRRRVLQQKGDADGGVDTTRAEDAAREAGGLCGAGEDLRRVPCDQRPREGHQHEEGEVGQLRLVVGLGLKNALVRPGAS